MAMSAFYTLSILFLLLACPWRTAAAETLTLHTRARLPAPGAPSPTIVEKTVTWDPARTALVVCDMWDQHHCPGATQRVAELAPAMNEALKAARRQGVLIIHCPSDTMDFYQGHPGRLLAQAAPPVSTAVPLQNWCPLDGVKEPALPIDDSDGGCDACPACPNYRAWTRQHPALEIMPGDAITDSAEAYYLMRQRGITNVLVMGVHLNMCVLGRPFAIRQMVAQGQQVLLVRDLTDSMYNHLRPPYVSHFRGTELVVEHIEQYACPSITSSDLVGGPPFRFRADVPKRIALVIGENEYRTWETLPAFARDELEKRGYAISLVQASPTDGDPLFQNAEAIRDADLVILSARRRAPPRAMLDLLRAHLAAGKPLVGLRTASHAFDTAPRGPDFAAWSTFDIDILGAHYQGHYGNIPPNSLPTLVETVARHAAHPVLTGVDAAPFAVNSHLYINRNLAPSVLPLLQGHVQGQSTLEPLAWVNTAQDRRVFYTSLGNPDDFQLPAFRRLLLNGVLWCLGDPLPPAPTPNPASKPESPPAPLTPPAPAPPAPPADLPQETKAPALSPAEALARFRVADDLEWQQVLAEPQITQPVFLNFDQRGRMWVVEYRQYPSPAGLKIVSRDSVWRAVYDRVPPPPPHHFPGADRISIHEDSDGDGTFDRHKIFLDGLNIATSLEHGRGGVWVLNPPYLLFYADANGDDVPDGDPEVRLSGFGLEDTHSVANSLRWGPDGWLYGAQGSTVTANIVVSGRDGKPQNSQPIYSQGQNIWRYHPEKRIYEVFAQGGGNAFGCEIDSQGRLFSGHNGGDTRGFHYQQGAYLQKGFEKHGPLSNPFAFGYFPAMPHDAAARFTHNFVIYDHGALPSPYRGHLFGVEPLQGRLVESTILPDGSSFRTRDLPYPLTSDDRWFRPVDIKVGPEGAIYVADWYDQQVNHYRNNEGQIDKDRGRIYRLQAKGAKPLPPFNLAQRSPTQLLQELRHPNRWVRQTALRLLADRPDASLLPDLIQALPRSTGQAALETLWALHLSGGLHGPTLLSALTHPEPQVRLWSARLAGDLPPMPLDVAAKLAALAPSETSLEVRNQLAATAQRMDATQALELIKSLAGHSEDVADNRQPLLLWWALEAHCGDHPEAVLQLYADPAFWRTPLAESHLIERTARRFAQAGSRRDFLTCARLFELSPSPQHSALLMAGLEAACKGRTLTGLPESLLTAMARHGVASPALALRQGDPQAAQRALRAILDDSAPREERLAYLGLMGEVKIPGAAPALCRAALSAGKDQSLQKAILTAFQNYDDPAIADVALTLYPILEGEALACAQTLLASRPQWALLLAQSIKSDGAPHRGIGLNRETLPPSIVLKLKEHPSPELRAILERLWPNTPQSTASQVDQEIQRLTEVLQRGPGDPYAGRTLFQNSCAACHRLFGQGGQIGPDLTVHDRSNLEAMLLAIVHPSAEIREGFENVTLETRDGRSLSGFLVEQDANTVVLRGFDNQNLTLPRTDLLKLEPAGRSLMPEGLLQPFADQQMRDLFAYLRSTQPLVGSPPSR